MNLHEVKTYDALIIGAGPGGSTLANLLSRAGKKVIVFEQSVFPRFHIGESLLPASLPILEELGMKDYLEKKAVYKPGGVWIYHYSESGKERSTGGLFSRSIRKTSFKNKPYAYMVERSSFDLEMANRAILQGADIRFNHFVSGILGDENDVKGLRVRDNSTGESKEYFGKMLYDCSGLHSFIGKKFNLRQVNDLKRLAVFGQFQVEKVHPSLIAGCFVGHVIKNGWTWYIPLSENILSVGVVAPMADIKNAKSSPKDYLLSTLKSIKSFDKIVKEDYQLKGEVKLMANFGATSDRIYGKGWATIGDSAFFIDPCFSSGVHMSILHAKKMSELHIRSAEVQAEFDKGLDQLSREMMSYYENVKRAVDTFYLTTQSKWCNFMTPFLYVGPTRNYYLTVLGGDFDKCRRYMKFSLSFLKGLCFFEKCFNRIFQRTEQNLNFETTELKHE